MIFLVQFGINNACEFSTPTLRARAHLLVFEKFTRNVLIYSKFASNSCDYRY